MGYLTVKRNAQTEFTEKKSVFIGNAGRVESEEEARAFIDAVRAKYKEARHHVYAYTLGEQENIQRYSDDGEPQGTGGIPVLEVIRRSSLRNTVVVVTRYFGGVLLGAGGLTRAYVRGASDALKEAGILERVEGYVVVINLSYELLGKVQHYLQEGHVHIEDTVFGEDVEITVHTETGKEEDLVAHVRELTRAQAEVSRKTKAQFFKDGDRLYIDVE